VRLNFEGQAGKAKGKSIAPDWPAMGAAERTRQRFLPEIWNRLYNFRRIDVR